MVRLILICLVLLCGCSKPAQRSGPDWPNIIRWSNFLDTLPKSKVIKYPTDAEEYNVSIGSGLLVKNSRIANPDNHPTIGRLSVKISNGNDVNIGYSITLIPVDGGWSMINGMGVSKADGRRYILGEDDDDETGLQQIVYEYMGGKLGDTLREGEGPTTVTWPKKSP